MREAHNTLDAFMHSQVTDRKTEVRSGAPSRDDVFSMLVRANEEDGGKFPLSETELVS
jgi:cytochrome P450